MNDGEEKETRRKNSRQLSKELRAKYNNNGYELKSSSKNEAAHLQQRLRNLSSELVTLRNRLHVNNNGQSEPNNNTAQMPASQVAPQSPSQHHYLNGNINANNNSPINNNNTNNNTNSTSTNTNSHSLGGNLNNSSPLNNILPPLRPHLIIPNGHLNNYPNNYPINKPLPPQPTNGNTNGNNNNSITNHNSHINNGTNISSSSGSHNNSSGLHNGSHQLNHSNSNSSSGGYYVNQHFPKEYTVCTTGGTASEGKPSASVIGTATTSSNTPSVHSESSFKLSAAASTSAVGSKAKIRLADIDDLIYLLGPVTEDSIIRCLQARCATSKLYAYVGPILLLSNPLTSIGNSLTLNQTRDIPIPVPIKNIVQEALRQQGDTGYPQAIVFSGCSGSGKSYASMLVLRQLFELAGGGLENDTFKHLQASISVLRSLGTARTATNCESSRIGQFIEVQITDGTIHRTKTHCYFLDQSRVVSRSSNEKNYHIFYQMLAGLSADERAKLHLGDHNEETLRYLNSLDYRSDKVEDEKRFLEFKGALGLLGIPFFDVVRVFAAVVLLGNVQFLPSSCNGSEFDVEGESELHAAANLLGVSETALRLGLTTRTTNVRSQLVRTRSNAKASNSARDSLAKSLYCRTVATIVKRANSLKRLGCNSGTTLSCSDSADSINNPVASQHGSTIGTAGSKASKSMTALNNAVRQSISGFIGILDLFGFDQNSSPSYLEHLCINLTAETMQHFYNTHIFKASIESCKEEGIQCCQEELYVDNVPCIDLISSLRTGLFSMLDTECSLRSNVETFVQKVRSQHKQNPRLIETKSTDLRSLVIQHYAGKVHYDASDFLDRNRDILADDLVAVFHKHRCSFGFASHLFSTELKILGAGGIEPSPRGISFRISRISPTQHSELLNGEEPITSLTQDFHTRLDNLLRTLVHTRPHFIRCIKINNSEQPNLFDRYTVSKQLRAFQVLETVSLMASGYPHRMRFRAFNSRYKLLAQFYQLSRTDDRAIEDCQLILESFDNSLERNERIGHASLSWALGKKHIFLSEGARQQLESLRISTRNRAATQIQSVWRGWNFRKKCPIIRHNNYYRHNNRYPRYPNNPNNPPPVPPPNVPSSLLRNNHVNSSSSATIHLISPLISSNSGPISPHGGNHSNLSSGQELNRITQITNTASLPHILNTNHPVIESQTSKSLSGLAGMEAIPIPAPRNQSSSAPALSSSMLTNHGGLIHHSNHQNHTLSSNNCTGNRPKPISISGTPMMERCDPKLLEQTCNLFGLDMKRPPPLPPSRSYTVVAGNSKVSYPQKRIMKMTYPDESTRIELRLMKGEKVLVIGASQRRGYLLVEHNKRTIDVPFQYLLYKQ